MLLNSKKFGLIIEKIVKEKRITYMDAVLNYCEDNNLDSGSINTLINNGVQYEIAKNVSILEEKKQLFLINEKHKVAVPEKFKDITKFVFEEKIVGFKSIKSEFNNIADEIIHEFFDAMKNMKIFN